ncbi:PQ-loop-domain-containing protein [Mycena sanguinolenta]|nr:PQ-loop-domain-containing protein [Mycena sanguinolenta]
MLTNRVAENVFGTLGTICWTVQLVPQVWKSYRDKSTQGLSEWMVLCWAISGGFFGVYVIDEDLNIPLILQPQLSSFLCLVSWGQCQYYGSTRPHYVSFIMSVVVILALGGFEVGMVFATRPSSNEQAIQFFGIFSSVLIALGLLTQYYEIYQRREVVGVSILFMAVDCAGGVFSDLSLIFKPKFDGIAAITYTLVIVMDGLVILAAMVLNPRARKRRLRLEEANRTNLTSPEEPRTVQLTPQIPLAYSEPQSESPTA